MQQPCANICTALVHEQVLACAQSLRHMHFSKLATRHSPKAYMKHFISGSPPPHSQIGCTLFRILNTAKAATRQMLMSVAMTGVYCTHDERCKVPPYAYIIHDVTCNQCHVFYMHVQFLYLWLVVRKIKLPRVYSIPVAPSRRV